jgi:hypothetical protein
MMVYKVSILMEPYLCLATNDYQTQVRLERQAVRQGIAFVRMAPTLPLKSERKSVHHSMVLAVMLCSAMIVLGSLHIYLTLTAQTTLEFHSQRTWCRFCSGKRRHRWKHTRPYSFSRRIDNWKRVFGRNWVRSLLIPNTRPPEYLPFPIPGHNGLRSTRGDFSNVRSSVEELKAETILRGGTGSWKC